MRTIPFLLTVLILGAPLRAAVIYVDAAATGSGDGSTWRNAFTSLTDAINRAAAGDELWVAAGTYGPISLKSGVKVFGGFSGNETTAAESDPDVHLTVISGGRTARAVTSVDNSASTVLRGFVIRDGIIAELAEQSPNAGGGLYLKNSEAMFIRCVFTNNASKFAGGAVANYGGFPSFVNCTFRNNGTADGIEAVGGGAVFNHDGNPRFVNCLFVKNRAGDGGAVATLAGQPEFINCTFVSNEATKRNGGAVFDNRGEALLRNCILWDNRASAPWTKQIYNNPQIARRTNIGHSNVQGGWSGTGNIDADPLFVDAAAGDFRLRGNSPCRDTGRSDYLPPEPAELNLGGSTASRLSADLRMQGRVEGNAVDMGAFERASTDTD